MGRRKQVGKGRDPSRASGWYIRVNGKKTWFATQEERDEAWAAKVEEVESFGFGAAGTLGAHDRLAMADMIRRAAEIHATPLEVFQCGLDHWRAKTAALDLQDAVDKFCADQDRRVESGEIRAKTAKDFKWMLRTFATWAGRIPVTSITQALVDSFSSRVESRQSRFNRVARVAIFCSWLVRHGHLTANPIRRPKARHGVPVIFDRKRAHAILRLAETRYRDLLPILVLQWLAGMRPSATHRLRWENINFARKHIAVTAGASKSGEPEILDHVQPVVWRWLRPLKKKAGPLCDGYHIERYQELKRELEITDWPQDVARHTFASNLYGLTGSIDAVRNALLHQTTRITLKHYVAKGVSKAEAGKYFFIRARRHTT